MIYCTWKYKRVGWANLTDIYFSKLLLNCIMLAGCLTLCFQLGSCGQPTAYKHKTYKVKQFREMSGSLWTKEVGSDGRVSVSGPWRKASSLLSSLSFRWCLVIQSKMSARKAERHVRTSSQVIHLCPITTEKWLAVWFQQCGAPDEAFICLYDKITMVLVSNLFLGLLSVPVHWQCCINWACCT